MRPRAILLLALLAAAACAPGAGGRPEPRPLRPPHNAAAATARVRALFFLGDHEGGYIEGRRLVERFPTAPALRAWVVLNAAGSGLDDDASRALADLEHDFPGDRWDHFARAWVRSGDATTATEALEEARLARTGAEWDPDMVWVYAVALYDQPLRGQEIALVDSAVARGVASAELLVRKGRGQESLAWLTPPDSLAHAKACAMAAEALQVDGASVNAMVLAADCLSMQGMDSAAMDRYRQAAGAAPLSPAVHQAYWRSVQAQQALSPEEKRRRIEADARAMLAAAPDRAGTLANAVAAFATLGMAAQQDSLETALLARFPGSVQAEKVHLDRVRRMWPRGGDPTGGPQPSDSARRVMVAMLREFIARPEHASETNLGEAWYLLYGLVRGDTAAAGADLTAAVEGAALHDRLHRQAVIGAPVLLADRGLALDLAERLAREIPARSRERIELTATHATGDTASVRREAEAVAFDALGWVHLKQGRADTAAVELRRAVRLDRANPDYWYHLGQAEEARGRLDDAETAYIRGLPLERYTERHRNDRALRQLTAARGSPERYDRAIARLEAEDEAARSEQLFMVRLKPAQPLTHFILPTIDGGRFDTRSALGKVLVVTFWGVWCGPCRLEMPALQRVYRRYAADPDVVMVTVDAYDPPKAVRDYMADHGLTLPVLLDDGYAGRADLGFPTTWFIDRSGGIQFIASGAGVGTDATLPQEFAWRIETLKAEKSAAP